MTVAGMLLLTLLLETMPSAWPHSTDAVVHHTIIHNLGSILVVAVQQRPAHCLNRG
jgi:hypothetical protein